MDCLFFINPEAGSGHGGKLAEELDNISLPSPILKQVIFTDPPRLASQVFSCAQGKDLVVICGGDGTVGAIMAQLVHLDRVPIVAIIPLGTGNDLARATGWFRSWMELGLEGLFYAIKEAKVGQLDVWELTISHMEHIRTIVFSGYAGFGYDGEVCQDFLRLNSRLNKLNIPVGLKRLLYLPACLKIFYRNLLSPERIRCSMEYWSGKKKNILEIDRLGQILLCNIGYYAGGSLLFKDFQLGDGALEYFGFRGFFHYLQVIFEGWLPVKTSGLDPVRANTFQFVMHNPCYFQVDGEPQGIVEKGSLVQVTLKRVVPLLMPFKDREIKEKTKSRARSNALEELSSVSPVTTLQRR